MVFSEGRFVTGGNNGIGYETVKALLESDKPHHILVQIDLTSDESIEAAFEQVIASATFDIAFLANKVSLRECFTKSYDVNVAGTNVITWTFVPLLCNPVTRG
ncbi:hypothetical protein MMC13_008164 [Lambiella insularis]|nr:hypothetical protein [Lambiella insularis]